ncbi:unnamed protein product, partial [Closterium sp. NIES-65]
MAGRTHTVVDSSDGSDGSDGSASSDGNVGSASASTGGGDAMSRQSSMSEAHSGLLVPLSPSTPTTPSPSPSPSSVFWGSSRARARGVTGEGKGSGAVMQGREGPEAHGADVLMAAPSLAHAAGAVAAGRADGDGSGARGGGKEIFVVSDGTAWAADRAVGAAVGLLNCGVGDGRCSVHTRLYSQGGKCADVRARGRGSGAAGMCRWINWPALLFPPSRPTPQVTDTASLLAIIHMAASSGALLVHSLADPALRHTATHTAAALHVAAVDLLGPLLTAVGEHMGVDAVGTGQGAGGKRVGELGEEYFRRIEAVEFTIRCVSLAPPACLLLAAPLCFLLCVSLSTVSAPAVPRLTANHQHLPCSVVQGRHLGSVQAKALQLLLCASALTTHCTRLPVCAPLLPCVCASAPLCVRLCSPVCAPLLPCVCASAPLCVRLCSPVCAPLLPCVCASAPLCVRLCSPVCAPLLPCVCASAPLCVRLHAWRAASRQDDGALPRNLGQADIILVGVSRTGKTPLSMHLAHMGYKVANVPLVPGVAPPAELLQADHVDQRRVFALTIAAPTLAAIRCTRYQRLGLLPQQPHRGAGRERSAWGRGERGAAYGEGMGGGGRYCSVEHVRGELEAADDLFSLHPLWPLI